MSEYRLRPATAEDLPALLKILDGAVDWLGGRGTDQWQGARWRAEELSPDLATGGLRVAEIWPDASPATGASPTGGLRVVETGVAASPAAATDAASAAAAVTDAAVTDAAVTDAAVADAASAVAAVTDAAPAVAAVTDAAAGGFRAVASPGPVAVGTMVLRDTHPADLWHPADDPGSALYLHHLAVDRAFAGQRVGAWLLDQAAAEARLLGKRFLRLDAWTTNTRLHDYYRGQGFRLVRIADDTSGALFERPVSLL